jgi:hypothetical protein
MEEAIGDKWVSSKRTWHVEGGINTMKKQEVKARTRRKVYTEHVSQTLGSIYIDCYVTQKWHVSGKE